MPSRTVDTLGILYLVATPIGNLDDISLRALKILKAVDYIAAEDTRHTRQLLTHFGIQRPLIALHDYNEEQRSQYVLKHLHSGQHIALVSDAGTPLISDPGYVLVRTVKAAGISVVPIPGPCAAIAALIASGLPTDHFVFEGFLPAKTGARDKRLQALMHESRTIIFYEAVHRILATLEAMVNIFGGDRPAAIARELTKRYETIHQASLHQLFMQLSTEADKRRGEFVIMVHGELASAAADADKIQEARRVLALLLSQLPLKQAVSLAANICQINRNAAYQLALTMTR